MGVVNQHAHGGVWVEWVARLPVLRFGFQSRQELVGDALLQQQAGAGDAHLALVVEDAAGGGADRFLQIRAVGEDDVGALAARFQPDALHIAVAGVFQQLLAGAGGAGKSNDLHVRMQGERLSGLVTKAADHVQHAVRQASLFRQPGEAQGGERRFFRRLKDHAVACRQRRTELPAGQQQREVPWHHRGDDANRFADDHRQLVAAGGGHFAIDFIQRFGIPADGAGGAGNIVAQAVANRFAGIQRFQQRQLFAVGLHQVGEACENRFTLRGGGL